MSVRSSSRRLPNAPLVRDDRYSPSSKMSSGSASQYIVGTISCFRTVTVHQPQPGQTAGVTEPSRFLSSSSRYLVGNFCRMDRQKRHVEHFDAMSASSHETW